MKLCSTNLPKEASLGNMPNSCGRENDNTTTTITKDVLIPRTCEFLTLHGKGEPGCRRNQLPMRWVDCLNYSGGPNVIMGPFLGKGGEKRASQRSGEGSRGQSSVIAGFGGERGPWPKNCGQPLKVGEDEQVNSFLGPVEKNAHLPAP